MQIEWWLLKHEFPFAWTIKANVRKTNGPNGRWECSVTERMKKKISSTCESEDMNMNWMNEWTRGPWDEMFLKIDDCRRVENIFSTFECFLSVHLPKTINGKSNEGKCVFSAQNVQVFLFFFAFPSSMEPENERTNERHRTGEEHIWRNKRWRWNFNLWCEIIWIRVHSRRVCPCLCETWGAHKSETLRFFHPCTNNTMNDPISCHFAYSFLVICHCIFNFEYSNFLVCHWICFLCRF